MNPSPLLKVASVMLTVGAWIVLEGSPVAAQSSGTDLDGTKVAGAANETAPSAAKPPLQFADCVKVCIHRMETAKAECATREPPAHNYDINKCVLGTEDEIVNCVRACNPSTQ